MPEHSLRAGKRTTTPLKTESSTSILNLVYQVAILRSIIKWLVRVVTGTCQLQRIIQKHEDGVCTVKVEECLRRSKRVELRRIIEEEPSDIEAAVKQIMQIKHIVEETNPKFSLTLRTCLEQIYGYESLFGDVEALRNEKYDCNNENHEEMLLKLWQLLRPDEPLEKRVSKQWCNIGFQGDDPKTDFRGMGLLGLSNLVYFAENHPQLAGQTLQHSFHPKHGYSYAIAGINITSMTHELMSDGRLRSHFFNTVMGRPDMAHFHQVYCYLFYEFDKFWVKSEPENVMAFSKVRSEFLKTVQDILSFVPSARLVIEH